MVWMTVPELTPGKELPLTAAASVSSVHLGKIGYKFLRVVQLAFLQCLYGATHVVWET
jgi:hypothetical protein